MNLNEMSARVHAANKKWWVDLRTGEPITRNKGELLALIHSEVSECADGEFGNLMDDKITHRKMGEVECGDGVIRIFDYVAGFGYDLQRNFDFEFSAAGFCVISEGGSVVFNTVRNRGIKAIHSYISKVLELERKSKPPNLIEDALLDCIIAFVAYSMIQEYDIFGAVEDKMLFNATRIDHTAAHRLTENGKKF